MDALVVGALGAATTVFGLLAWLLMARPELVLVLWSDHDPGEDPVADHPGAIRLLRWISVVTTFLLGFLTGLAVTFLSGTS